MKKQPFLDSTLKKSLLASIIASAIVIIFIKPILNAAWNLVLSLSDSYLKTFSDSIYRTAALGQRDWVIVFLLIMFLGALTGIMTGVILGVTTFKSEKIKRILRKKKSSIIFWILLGLFYLYIWFAGVTVAVKAFADLQLNTSFQQRLSVLSPAISDLEYKKLKAAWAVMRSKKDHDEIVKNMENIASKNSINLPELLLK